MEMPVSRHLTVFRDPKTSLGGLDADAIAVCLAAAADVTIVVDKHGIVTDVAFGSEDLYSEGFGAWVGLPWVDTFSKDSQHKTEEMLREAALKIPTRWRELNHPGPDGESVPVRYSAIQILKDGALLAFGRDLRPVAALQQRLVEAQASIEKDYARLRQTELRYRLLFQMTSEAIVVVEAATGKIADANPAALSILGSAQNKIAGQNVLDLFGKESLETAQQMLATIRSRGSADTETLHLAASGAEFMVTGSLFRQMGGSHVLLRFATGASEMKGDPLSNPRGSLVKIIEQFPDAFVVTDPSTRILTVNSAFLDLAELATEEQARGELLGRWLGRSSVDLNVLVSGLRDHGSIKNFATVATGAFGSIEDVDVSAVAVLNAEPPCLGFAVRRLKAVSPTGQRLPRSVEQLTELVGRVPLKDLVRETSDLIEKLCIEAALELSGDNRASAAEMLGLSRQSLYVKLRRYGLGDLSQESNAE